ncbi:MAG TPA: DUF2971 domain-containing protein [Caulobacteraceae bacterium]|jgi:hypothetical protein
MAMDPDRPLLRAATYADTPERLPGPFLETRGQRICDEGFIERHPELHHYTSLPGLAGILITNTLWCTHYSGLNDTSELKVASNILVSTLSKHLLSRIASRRKASLKAARLIDADGGPLQYSTNIAGVIVEAFNRAVFEELIDTRRISNIPDRRLLPLYDPFITSFCSHSSDGSYERANGLLSQWRGYGKGGGYCLVFDTRKLLELLSREFHKWQWSMGRCASVRYADDEFQIKEEYPTVVNIFEKIISNFERRELNDLSDIASTEDYIQWGLFVRS